MTRTTTAIATGLVVMLGMTFAPLAVGTTVRPGSPASAGSADSADTADTGASRAHRRAATSYTRVTLNIDTCSRCPVDLVQAIEGRGSVWRSRTERVKDGAVSFRVPTRRTHQMSFEINPRWSVLNVVPNIVTRYHGIQVGDIVTDDVAPHKKRAAGCWAGTSARRITLDVRAVKFPARDLEGNPGFGLRAWFEPTMDSSGPMVPTFKGAIGNQDAFFCTA
jgi:hypothetical protein